MAPPMAFSLFIFLFLSPSLAIPSPSSSSSPNTHICNSTPYPFFCKTLLPNNKSASVQDHGKYSFHRAISVTRDYISLVDRILEINDTLSQPTVCALEDCQLLIDLNLDFLLSTLQAVDSRTALKISQVDDKHTLLSAVLTNHQTCLDGLIETNSASIPETAPLSPLRDGNMLYSVSLALFMQGWVHGRKNLRRLAEKKLGLTEVHEAVSRGRKPLLGFDNMKYVTVRSVVVVSQDGKCNFTSINDAVAAAPNKADGSSGYFVIYVAAGVYEEYVVVPKKKRYVMMIGDGVGKTIITGNRNVADGWTTLQSATFAVIGEGFVGVNFTIRNTAGPIKNQAVALRNSADQSAFYKCSFEGYQDTLYAHSLRQFYKMCDIYGTIDFIFGNAAAVIQNCNVLARKPMEKQFDTITAQSREDVNQNTGFSIQNCTVSAAPEFVGRNGTTRTYLGRPWREYSRVVYMESCLDGLIDPAGWKAWEGDSAPDTVYYAEFCNYGSGSDTTGRVTWRGYHLINSTEANDFTVDGFISGDEWLPATQVPYNSGLA